MFGREGRHWVFYMPRVFFHDNKRDLESSVTGRGHKGGLFAESTFKPRMFWLQAWVPLSGLATWGQNLQIPQVDAGILVRNCNLWLKNVFRKLSTTSLYRKNPSEALKLYV